PLMIRIPDGEKYKTLQQVNRIYDRLIQHRFERSSTLVALGGGVIGDITGFAAATFLRGVSYVQCPTTIVAQVDASIGGKTGVDHSQGKNLIGAFHQPRLVCADPEVLTTLPRREFAAGLAEVVKYGVILDRSFFKYLEEHSAAILSMDRKHVLYCVEKSAALKAKVVQSDERESGLRKILNYGHTLGHAVETLTGYRTYKHGEAVAIGMAAAARLSYFLGLSSWEEVQRQTLLLRAFGLPTTLPKIDLGSILEVIRRDKKVVGGAIYFILPAAIGKVQIQKVEEKTLIRFLKDVS
ncbi:MAG TPA: 3-dehydroquinate synthase, partial [Candidatus Manganitrophaceae bacterium]|nr:3-dehydroquinate synthase [Candidatus Manganitrophaceae bacterium]